MTASFPTESCTDVKVELEDFLISGTLVSRPYTDLPPLPLV